MNGSDRAKALHDDWNAAVVGGAQARSARDQDRGRREGAVGALVVHEGQADLLQVVGALGAPGGLARGLDGGQQQGDQDGDDGDDDQQLDQREATQGLPGADGYETSTYPLGKQERREDPAIV